MCGWCVRVSRRGVLAAAVLPFAGDDIVEPRMQLAEAGVAITLDACSGETDWRILKTLVDLAIPATVFATGLWLRGNAAALQTMLAHKALFSLQNHGARHLPPVLGERRVYGLKVAGTMAAIGEEVAGGASALAAALGGQARWYRGAAGLYTRAALAPIQAMGWKIAGYSLNADQGASLAAVSVARRMEAARSGDVIIAHINQPHRQSGAGVAAGLVSLQRAGTRFVRLDDAAVAPLGLTLALRC